MGVIGHQNGLSEINYKNKKMLLHSKEINNSTAVQTRARSIGKHFTTVSVLNDTFPLSAMFCIRL